MALPLVADHRVVQTFARAQLSAFLVAHAQRKQFNAMSQYGPSSEEVARLLTTQDDLNAALADELPKVAAARADVLRIAQGHGTLGAQAPLARIQRVFGLPPIDIALVALLLAPELSHELERAYAFAHDDFSKKRGDIAFVARLYGAGDETAEDEVLRRFSEDAPLRRYGVVTLSQSHERDGYAMRYVRLADRLVAALRGHDTIDEAIRGVCTVCRQPPAVADVVMAETTTTRIARGLGLTADSPHLGAARLLLAGPDGIGRGLIVEALYGAAGRQVVRIDLAALVSDSVHGAARLAAALREAALRDAAAILDGGTTIKDEMPRAMSDLIGEACIGLAVPIVFTLQSQPAWLAHIVPDLVELVVPAPSLRERRTLWQRALPGDVAHAADIETVAARYSFSGAAIARAARRALAAARLRDPHRLQVTLDDLGDASRLTFSHRLGGMAQRIPTGFRWSDLVLPSDTLEAVQEVVKFARHRPFLLEEWGFAAKLPYGRGVSAILAGPPGTGKTMVAQLLANELGYDLYRIDLSQVVNKYIGETEKNLARIFEEAESSHAVLFFDEADSLFAKRTEVKSSNDRYANLEVNYLLQRMETYDGVTLLATNLEQGLDEAFKRRVRFSVQFELPEETERKRLWISMFPPQVPLAADIDWDLVAKKFEMSGGYIKKAAVRAALSAAESQRPLTTEDIYEAARAEYREMGRIV